MDLIDPFSRPAIYIELFSKEMPDVKISTGTAFLIHVGSKYLLATNWHIVNGKKSWNHDEILHPNGAIPGSMKVFFRLARKGEMVLEQVDLPLYSANDEPLWIEHRERHVPREAHGPKFAIDVALLDVTKFIPQFLDISLDWNGNRYFHLPVTEHVSVVGYPFGHFGRSVYPIWISGTVANDLAGVKGNKYFLIDARTREGNSGSMVVHRTKGAEWHKPGGSMSPKGEMTYFMGIYSGRIHNKESDVGIVWHWEVIEELLREIIPEQEQTWRPAHERRVG